MKKLIAAVIASAFAFGAASTTFAADMQHKPAQTHVVKVKKSHKAHKAHKAQKKARKVHTVQKVKAPKMHAVKYHKKHSHKQVRKAVR